MEGEGKGMEDRVGLKLSIVIILNKIFIIGLHIKRIYCHVFLLIIKT